MIMALVVKKWCLSWDENDDVSIGSVLFASEFLKYGLKLNDID
jgi:hypothetical protein